MFYTRNILKKKIKKEQLYSYDIIYILLIERNDVMK